MPTENRIWLLLGPLAASTADAALTLAFQPTAYWSGDYSAIREWNPVGRVLLGQHPLLFAAVAFGWIVLVAAAIFTIPRRHAIVAAIAYLVAMEQLWTIGRQRMVGFRK